MFKLVSQFKPTGDQPDAIDKLVANLNAGAKHQVLLGVTGSGKTFSLANVIERTQKPTLVISHNKVLAAQLYQEFKEFFPENAVHYFVSYYDYYQPEAYLPSTDTYIEKDAKINDLIDQLRHAATADILSRKDVIIVASVSCIYGIGDPETYQDISLNLTIKQPLKRDELLRHLVELQYRRNDIDPVRGEFRARGNNVAIWLPHGTEKIELTLDIPSTSGLVLGKPNTSGLVLGKHTLQAIERTPLPFKSRDPHLKRYNMKSIRIFPAKHFVTPQPKLALALKNIEAELVDRLQELREGGKLLEAQRLEERVNFDLEMFREAGYCPGVENYSRHLAFRKEGAPPFTLIDYFHYAYSPARSGTKNNNSRATPWLCVIDESHISVPQIKGMYEGDHKRKSILVEHGFRLPSALDNRPLKFSEFEKKIPQTIYVSATPSLYEIKRAEESARDQALHPTPCTLYPIVEQLIRPTGILDPEIEIRPLKNQVNNLEQEILKRIKRNERILAIALTKRLAEDLAEYLIGRGLKVHWIHSEVKTLLRTELLKDLREGKVDVLVGVNLLREGLDLPEVSLVAILDADKEGFLRNTTTLIQTMGRASRHVNGKVILYADRMTGSMKEAISEVARRRKVQEKWNRKYGIKPKPIIKPIRPALIGEIERTEKLVREFEKGKIRKAPQQPKGALPGKTKESPLLNALEREMWHAAKEWDFEKAARIRDQIEKLKREI